MAKDKKPTRIDKRRRRTRNNLFTAVRKLTAEKGVDAVTIRDIADEADIAVGSFYSFFDSKEALLNEAVKEILFEMGEMIDSFLDLIDDPLEKIATAFTMFDKMSEADPVLGWFVVRVTEYSSEWAGSLMSRFVRDVTQGIESGAFKVPDVALATELAVGCFINFARERMQGRMKDEGVAHFIHMTLRLLGADEKAAEETAHRVWESLNG